MEKKILDFTVIIEQDEDGVYVASVPDIQGCNTQGRSVEEVLKRIKEAIELCLEAADEDISPMNFLGVQKVNVNKPVTIWDV